MIRNLFSTVVAPPLGLLAIDQATKAVFAPNFQPAGYIEKTKALQALNPSFFRHNAMEVCALSNRARTFSPRYRSIRPTIVIVTGDTDGSVSSDVHARHLVPDIPGSRLIVVHDLGHKSVYVASDLSVAAIERVTGRKVNLRLVARAVEKRIAHYGKEWHPADRDAQFKLPLAGKTLVLSPETHHLVD